MKTTIKGAAYAITKAEGGWNVTRTEKRIDRIGRSYFVRAAGNGAPVACSCPDHHHRGVVCKHMTAILDDLLGDGPPAESN